MYSKLFVQIFDSSIADDFQTRHVFMDLLVLADRFGVVDMTLDAIARRTNVPVEIVNVSICKLCKPDKQSRSSKEEGRRLIPLDEHRDWGWKIVNYEGYNKLKDENARREYMRTYMADRREQERACKHPVNSVSSGKPKLAHVDVDVTNKEYPPNPPKGECAKPPRKRKTPSELTEGQRVAFERFYSVYPRKQARAAAEIAWKKIPDDPELLEQIIAGAIRYQDSDAIKAHPASWLNGKRWLDDPDPEQRRGGRPDPQSQVTMFDGKPIT